MEKLRRYFMLSTAVLSLGLWLLPLVLVLLSLAGCSLQIDRQKAPSSYSFHLSKWR